MHALIIEDEYLIALALEDMLKRLGFTSFAWAATEDEAIDAAHRGRPALITADIQLRRGNGISAVMCILSEEPDIPVIFVTANDDLVAHLEGTVVLSKPVRLHDLRAAWARAQSIRFLRTMEAHTTD